jgi:hypothetical protein
MLPAASCDRVTCLCSQLLGGMLQSSRSCDHKMPQTTGFSKAPGSGVNLIGRCPQAWRGKLSSPATPIMNRDFHPNRSWFRLALDVYANFYLYVLPHDPGKSKSLLSWRTQWQPIPPRSLFGRPPWSQWRFHPRPSTEAEQRYLAVLGAGF